MPQISSEDSGILQLNENAKTNNRIAGYHLVSRHAISTPSDFNLCIDAPKRPSYYPPLKKSKNYAFLMFHKKRKLT